MYRLRQFVVRGALALLITGIHPALAAESWHTANVAVLYPFSDGNFAIMFTTNSATCTSPESLKRHHVLVGTNGMTAEGAKKIYAAAMLAMSLGKTLSVAFEGSDNTCPVNRAYISD